MVKLLVFILLGSGIQINAQGKEVNDKIIMLMHKPMMEQAIQKTDNPDLDFLVNMIPHHYGAILSSEEFLKVGKSQKALTLASNIIVAQKREIAEFEGIVEELKNSTATYNKAAVRKATKKSERQMNKMMKKMNKVNTKGSADKTYLMGMMPHHQGAVDTSETILSISTNETIIEIANRIIADQKKEIKDIRAIVAEL